MVAKMAQFDVMRPYYMMWTSKEIFSDLRSTFRFLFSQLLHSQKKGGGGGGGGMGLITKFSSVWSW